ncbi:hypothetical protein [Sphingobacterium prati]|uniref:hypothetical protein n=1 Tax=Sphingobacterium prati TaxID=2737006 RepID=UPI001552D363|nr:hypothetical protein [Sphingobacterium prati]NPE45745.1 hypothetical protein [Sphingobacterium prati]
MRYNTRHKKEKRPYNIVAALAVLAIIMTFMVTIAANSRSTALRATEDEIIDDAVKRDSVKSVAAFSKVYSVLISPRCVNCHPAGDVPLQGDDSHLHTMFPQRGKDGKGILTMKCTNCHQPENTPGTHTPPGSPNWHLPPADMKMVFEGKSPRELAKQIMDPTKNGNKDMKALIAHADDELVKWGWQPGEGRTLPPLSHREFKEAWITWLKNGAYAPTN